MRWIKRTALLLMLLDAFAVVFCFNLVALVYGRSMGHGNLETPILAPLLLPVLLFVLGAYLIDAYSTRTDMLSLNYTAQHVIALLSVLIATLTLTYVFIPPGFTLQSSRAVISFGNLLLIPVTLSYRRVLYSRVLRRQFQRYFIFVGSPESCLLFKEECRNNAMKQAVLYATVESFTRPIQQTNPTVSIPPFGDVIDYLKDYVGQIDAIILRETSVELPDQVAQKLMSLQFTGVPTYTLELFHQVYWRKIPLYRLNQTWLFQEGFQIAREPVFERLKRISDILFASIGLLLFAPIFPLAAFAIWLNDRGPIFFHQTRVGRNRVLFEAAKLRTMHQHAAGDTYTRENDQRITIVGKFLRATRLDEVPQLWNVLRGEMSLIGPRAELVKLVEEYEHKIPCYHFRHLVKPGITGWAQVNYPYGASIEDTLRKLEYDLYYLRYYSLVLDASIVLKTIQVMLFGQGR